MKKYVLLTALIILIVNSCTIEKRRYRSGYFIDWERPDKEIPVQIQRVKKDLHEDAFVQDKKAPDDSVPARINKPVGEVSVASVLREEELAPAPGQNTKPKGNNGQQTFKSGSGGLIRETTSRDHQKNKSENKNGDVLLLLSSVLIVLSTMGLIRTNRRRVTRLTRWAKANPKKTQGLIAALQLPLLALAFYSGHNLKELGYNFSDTATAIFAGITALGFLSVPFRAKQNTITLPKVLNRQRLGYLGITLSSLMMVTSIGNNFATSYPLSPVTHTLLELDHSFFPAHEADRSMASLPDTKSSIEPVQRQMVAGMSLLAAILLIILLCILICAGICTAIFGVVFLLEGNPLGAIGVFVGVGIVWLAILGIKSVVKKRRETKELEI